MGAGASRYGSDAQRDVGLAGAGAQNFATQSQADTARMGLDNQMTRFNTSQETLAQLMDRLDGFSGGQGGSGGGGGGGPVPRIDTGAPESRAFQDALINESNQRQRDAAGR